jgi:hypothetical protein
VKRPAYIIGEAIICVVALIVYFAMRPPGPSRPWATRVQGPSPRFHLQPPSYPSPQRYWASFRGCSSCAPARAAENAVRFLLAGTLALLTANVAVVSPALAGIDEMFLKPADKKSWGELLLDFVGTLASARATPW